MTERKGGVGRERRGEEGERGEEGKGGDERKGGDEGKGGRGKERESGEGGK